MNVSPKPIHPAETRSRSERLAKAFHASKAAAVKRKKTEKTGKKDDVSGYGQDSAVYSEDWDTLQKWVIDNIDSVQNMDMRRRDNYLEEMRLQMLHQLDTIQTEELEYSLELILQLLLDVLASSKIKNSVFLGFIIQWIIKYYDEQNALYRQQFVDTLGNNLPVLAKRVPKERIQNLIFKLLEEYEDAAPERQASIRTFFKKVGSYKQLRKIYQRVLTSYRQVVKPKDLKFNPYKQVDNETENDGVQIQYATETKVYEYDPMAFTTEVDLFKQPIPYRVIRKRDESINSLGIAFVVHASTTLARTQAYYSDLDIFRLPSHISRQELELFWERLAKQGFTKIVVLLPCKSRFSEEFDTVSSTATELCECIDTHTYGVGIGLVLQYAIAYCRQKKRRPTSLDWLDPALQRLKHWVISLQSAAEKQKLWLLEAEKEHFPDASQRVVVEFNSESHPIQFLETLTQSLNTVERRIELAQGQHPYRVIIIIHNTTFNDVVTAYAYHLRKEFPKIAVYIKHRSRRQPDLGEHISIAML
jgi:hypothetical protein